MYCQAQAQVFFKEITATLKELEQHQNIEVGGGQFQIKGIVTLRNTMVANLVILVQFSM